MDISVRNCLNSTVGSAGLSPADLSQGNAALASAIASVERQRAKGGLGFIDLPDRAADARAFQNLAKSWRGRYDNFVVVGIGGSALGNIALQTALRHPHWNLLSNDQRKGWLRMFVPDNVDPGLVGGLLDAIDVKKTIFNYNTIIAIVSHFLIFSVFYAHFCHVTHMVCGFQNCKNIF